MKICLIGPAYPLRGGIADFNEAFATALEQQGHSVKIFSFYFQYPKFLFPGKTQFAEDGKQIPLEIKATISSVNPFSWFSTAKKVSKENPDLVIIRYWLPFMAPALGTIAKRLRKKKIRVIAITDNVIPHESRPGDKQFTSYFVKNVDGFITMSKSVLDDLKKFTETDKKIFLPHPIYNIFGDLIDKQEARQSLGLSTDEKIILFFGFIRKYKGLNLLLKAMADERLKKMNVKLLVAGEFYEDEKPYMDQIQESEISDRVILHTNFIDKEKVKNHFCAADIVVQPYISATQSGITQVAYFFNRPMLVTNVGGLAEIVTDKRDGYVTDVVAEKIADALNDFYSNNREKEFSDNVMKDKERFSWNSFIDGMKKLYEEIK